MIEILAGMLVIILFIALLPIWIVIGAVALFIGVILLTLGLLILAIYYLWPLLLGFLFLWIIWSLTQKGWEFTIATVKRVYRLLISTIARFNPIKF
jgi:hypothetical protein